MSDLDSLRLELAAEKYARVENNNYLIGIIESIRVAVRKPNGVITNEWYWDAIAEVQRLLPNWEPVPVVREQTDE